MLHHLYNMSLTLISNLFVNIQINNFVLELLLEFRWSFIVSNSNFWWHPYQKSHYGAFIDNFIANMYTLQNGLQLAISLVTLSRMTKWALSNRMLLNSTPKQ